jgi:hypothetical protein
LPGKGKKLFVRRSDIGNAEQKALSSAAHDATRNRKSSLEIQKGLHATCFSSLLSEC